VSFRDVCLDVYRSFHDLQPTTIDRSQACKPYWIPYLPYFRCQMEKYGKFCQTLLVLQFVIEFANIWAQYSPSTYASTHVGFFNLCPNVQMAALSGYLLVTPLLLHGRTVGRASGRCGAGCCIAAARSRSRSTHRRQLYPLVSRIYSCHCKRDASCHMTCPDYQPFLSASSILGPLFLQCFDTVGWVI